MEFNTVLESRYSLRSYSEKKVEKEVLDAILEAGRIAPTARNMQPQRILVVQSEEGLEKMAQCTPCTFGAPVVLMVCFDKKINNNNGNYARVDASIVQTHMMLKAAELGLGSVWVGFFSHDDLREQFCVPDDYEIVSLLPLGYANTDAKPSAMHASRQPIEQTVAYESFEA